MELASKFLPFMGDVGISSILAFFFHMTAMFTLGAATVFFLATKNGSAPEHRTTGVLSAVICGVAAVSYFYIRQFYLLGLEGLAHAADPMTRLKIVHDMYLSVGQLRYMDWAVTTPLLLVKIVLLLGVKPRQARGALATLVLADFWMVLAGYIGEQQVTAYGVVLAGPRLFWGALSTVGYLVVAFVLFFRVWPAWKGLAKPAERRAFGVCAATVVTTWGVYPVGYLIPAFFPFYDLNWIHVVFTIADVINKVGVGVVAYLAGERVMEDFVPKRAEAAQYARQLG